MAKGKKTGGRQAGTPNKSTMMVKQAMEMAFGHMGGQEAFNAWCLANPDVFYGTLLPKLLPVQVNHADAEGGKLQPFSVNVGLPTDLEPRPAPKAGEGLPN